MSSSDDLIERARRLAGDHADTEPEDLELLAEPARHEPTYEEQLRAQAAETLDAPTVPVRRGATDAEIDAAIAAAGHAGTARRMALAAFRQAGPEGLTDYDLAVKLNAIPNRIATRRKELVEAGLVEAAPVPKRPTGSGIPAHVHRITELGLIVTQRPAPTA